MFKKRDIPVTLKVFGGYCWSVTPAAQYLWLHWDDDHDTPAGIGGEAERSNAYSVRCVQE